MNDPDRNHDLIGSGCPACGQVVVSYEVRYVYISCGLPNHHSCTLDPEASKWVLSPCGHTLTRSAWVTEVTR